MRVAAIYDIHGNLPALEAVLRDIRLAQVDQIVIGGDVGPGPMPDETIETLLSLDIPVRFIQGNGDREVLELMSGAESSTLPEQVKELLRHSAEHLCSEHVQLMTSWPKTLIIDIADLGKVMFCHATPESDTKIFTRLTPEDRLLPLFKGLNVQLIICGHTHMQFDRMIGKIRVVNAGSAGMPFGERGAYWLLLTSDVQLRHTTYDLEEAAERIRKTSYPQASDFAEHNILHPPTEQEMIEAFSKMELR
ncbi:MAG: metallophosphoesterase family protein [Chitinophagales bacterium]|nr:metallophosphoesterase family protein [Chitinophagales bacterium]